MFFCPHHPTLLAKTAPFWSRLRTESLSLWRCSGPSYSPGGTYSYRILNFPPDCHWIDLPFPVFTLGISPGRGAQSL